LGALLAEIESMTARSGPAAPLIAARLIVASAQARHESRGGHYRSDFPLMASPARRTLTTLAEVQARGQPQNAA
ncbi:MAG TPA: hypothetical protein VHX64_04760, partial [Caulobacteraceae bacterium]|nr:hypothetical protein [Caulobacteraceae bacterium]